MPAIVVVDSAWGDSGKGLISAYLTYKYGIKFVARAGTGSNAEHGIFLKDEKTYLKTNQLPLGFIFSPDANIYIGSGVAVNPILLQKEIDRYKLHGRVFVDKRCPITTPEHVERENRSGNMSSIGSTMSGTGATRADFVNRIAKQAKDVLDKKLLCDIGLEINKAASYGFVGGVTVESSQGTFLSLAVSDDYPNVTSDNVLSTSAMDDVLLNPRKVSEIWMVVKAMPTREGAGSMGAPELTEKEIVEKGLFEASSIGGKTRRKASEINFDMLKYACEINGATNIALTFVDHYDPECKNAKHFISLSKKVRLLIDKIEAETNTMVSLINTGKAYNNIIDMQGSIDWKAVDSNVERYAK